MADSERHDFYPYYGAVAFVAPQVVDLYQKKSGSAKVSRSFIDPFVRLGGYLLAQSEKVRDEARYFGDSTVPLLPDQTDETLARLISLLGGTAGEYALGLNRFVAELQKSKLRLCQNMLKVIIDCAGADVDFAIQLLVDMPKYINRTKDLCLPTRVFYLRLTTLQLEELERLKSFFSKHISKNVKEREMLKEEKRIADQQDIVFYNKRLLRLEQDYARILKIKSACNEAYFVAKDARNKGDKRYYIPMFGAFLLHMEGKTQTKTLYKLVKQFEKEDTILSHLGYYPGEPVDYTSHDKIYSDSSRFYPEERSQFGHEIFDYDQISAIFMPDD